MKPSLRFLLFLLGASLPGVFLGWWIAAPSTDDGFAELAVVQNPRPPEFLDQLRRNHLLAAVEAIPPPKPTESNTDEMQVFLDEVDASGMRVVPINSLRTLAVRAIEGGAVSDDMREILSLSPEEVERVNLVIQEAGDRLAEAELDRIETVDISESRAVFQVPALGEVGEQVKQKFEEELREVLGDMDANAFLTIMGDHHLFHWDGFGRYDRTITFSVEPREDGRVWVIFDQESPVEQVEAYYHARGEGIRGNIGGGRGFKTTYPYASGQSPLHRSLQRSRFLLPLLPEELRFYFEEVEHGR
jgi:hypothetical protein